MNEVILIGRIGNDLAIKYTANGDAVLNLSVATSEKFKNKAGELKESTEWHKVSVFGKQAENTAMYCQKGSQISVQGSLHTNSYDKDGTKVYSTEIRANKIGFLGSGKKETEIDVKSNNTDNRVHENLNMELERAVKATQHKFKLPTDGAKSKMQDEIPW